MAEPIFIGGCGRSGTTLFVDLLGCHSAIAPVYEPWFLCNIAELIFLRRDLPPAERLRQIRTGAAEWMQDLDALPHNKQDYERYRHGIFNIRFTAAQVDRETERLCRRLTAESPLVAFRDYALALFAAHAEEEGKPRWAAKVPRFVQMLPLLQKAFPDLRFFHCVRGPRATVASMASREWAPKTEAERYAYWRSNVESGVRFAAEFPSQCLEVRYEDLLADPGTVLSRSFGWLGIGDEAASIATDYRRAFPIDATRTTAGRHASTGEPPSDLLPLMRRFGYAPDGVAAAR